MAKQRIEVPLNRVEGDLEVRVEVEDGVVTDAWCSGTMYRGFERIMVGRGALDGLVITPRICGICTTAHLTAAVGALDQICGIAPPPDALRIRNIALLAEDVQSDVRQSLLMFAADFTNPAHREVPGSDEAVKRFAPLRGSSVIETIRETKKLVEVIAILGGQWPHSSFMVPGGVACVPTPGDLRQCGLLVDGFRGWYERQVLGCTLERWSQVTSADALDAWLEESPAHRDGDLGFILRFGRALGLDAMGAGHGAFVSFGSLALPEGTAVHTPDGAGQLIPSGFVKQGQRHAFDQSRIAEHTDHSWLAGPDGPVHPLRGTTDPYASGREGTRYSWAKAPRYDGEPAETGPLAEALAAEEPLLTDLVRAGGPSALVRQLARLSRPARLLPAMPKWIDETRVTGGLYTRVGRIEEGEGWGLAHAARGALGHWVRIEAGRIALYQIITPTAWNCSPRDQRNRRGPAEEALVGTTVRDPANPVELGHVVRSFDPCLVCTVHAFGGGEHLGKWSVGGVQ